MSTVFSTATAKIEQNYRTEEPIKVDYDLTKLTFNHGLNNIVGGDSLDTRETLRAEREAEEKRAKPSPSLRYAPVQITGQTSESCVAFAKRMTGIYRTMGWGARQGINSQTPKVGAIVAERIYIHAAVVREVKENGLLIEEANYLRGYSNLRFIPYSDVLGYVI